MRNRTQNVLRPIRAARSRLKQSKVRTGKKRKSNREALPQGQVEPKSLDMANKKRNNEIRGELCPQFHLLRRLSRGAAPVPAPVLPSCLFALFSLTLNQRPPSSCKTAPVGARTSSIPSRNPPRHFTLLRHWLE